jgi:hypothetical protein
MESYVKLSEVREKYLFIVSQGNRNNLLEVVNGTLQFSKIIEQTKQRSVLLDYRNVHFNLNKTDAFNIVRYYEQLPALSDVKIAALVNEPTLSLATIWQDVAIKRGFQTRYFLIFEEAENWLLSK